MVNSHDIEQGIFEPFIRINLMLFANGKERIDHSVMSEWGFTCQDILVGIGKSATSIKFKQGVAMCEKKG